ncbi:MAG TPA: asparagine synthase (glutamine-hydrolyzing) [Bacteroidota bacterium]|nr:asparagine synthase (glutamine-hydrolyzing) [Bacteroidota bacterium]
MCGICGVLHFESSPKRVDEPLLRRMTDTLAHRGPDSDGTYVSPQKNLGFGFRRLAIVDLSPAANQPMCNEDGTVWIVFNGEVYNHAKLRPELEARGHRYKSRSDTETLIHAYEEYGPRFVERLEGMFGMAIWDSRKGKLFLFRDRIGIKPLYYTLSNDRLIFASEIKAILQDPSIPRAVNETALSHYFTFIATPAPQTLFEGISKLEAGHFLEIDLAGRITNVSYWSVFQPVNGEDVHSEEYCARRIRELLEESIEKRMMSDVPFGVFLSGGIDSSTNVALMSKLMNRPVDTFSVAIEGQENVNEFSYARRIAKEFKTNHHEISINDDDFIRLFPKVIYHHDEPLADPVSFPLYYVSKLARDNGTIVVQVGEGSDEQFCGYTLYKKVLQLETQLRFIRSMPQVVRSTGYGLLSPILKSLRVDYRQNYIKNFLSASESFLGGATAFDDKEKAKLLRRSAASSAALVDEAFHAASGSDYSTKMIYWELKNRLPELLLMRVDKMSMATSVEARVPFLDHKLVEFSMKIPWQFKIKNGETKYILKKAVEGLIPQDIIYRKKIGFAGSGKNMLTSKILAYAKPFLLDYEDPYTDQSYIRTLIDEYERTHINYSSEIWTLINFKMWHKLWIAGEAIT